MLADAGRVMPDSLKFAGDKLFFEQALDGAALIVHGDPWLGLTVIVAPCQFSPPCVSS